MKARTIRVASEQTAIGGKCSALKTKPLVSVVSLAVAVLAGVLQQGLCAVGYVNVIVTNGYNLVANPLDQLPDDSITNLIPGWSTPNPARSVI